MFKRIALTTLALVALAAAPAMAQSQCSGEKAKADGDKACCAKDGSKATCDKSGDKAKCTMGGDKAGCSKDAQAEGMCNGDVLCDGTVVRVRGVELPRMGIMVDGKSVCCAKSAGELTKGDMSKVQYVVADKTYDNLGEAKAAFTTVMEDFSKEMLTVKYAVGDECTNCPITAKEMAKKAGSEVHYRLASFNFESQDSANAAADKARAAAKEVAMTMKVGDKSFCCPTEAGKAAEADGKKIEYCVGENKTGCEVTAKLNLAVARVQAEILALADAAGSET